MYLFVGQKCRHSKLEDYALGTQELLPPARLEPYCRGICYAQVFTCVSVLSVGKGNGRESLLESRRLED